jgi:hypothetical protein
LKGLQSVVGPRGGHDGCSRLARKNRQGASQSRNRRLDGSNGFNRESSVDRKQRRAGNRCVGKRLRDSPVGGREQDGVLSGRGINDRGKRGVVARNGNQRLQSRSLRAGDGKIRDRRDDSVVDGNGDGRGSQNRQFGGRSLLNRCGQVSRRRNHGRAVADERRKGGDGRGDRGNLLA